MAQPRKYMFDLDFGPPQTPKTERERERPRGGGGPAPIDISEDEVEEDLPPAVMFNEEELSLAREAAYEEGRRQGLAEAAEAAAQQTAQALTAIAAQLDGLAQCQAEANDEAARNAVRVALAAFKKMLPSIAESTAMDEVVRVVGEVVAQVLDEPRIIVRVNQDLAEALRERLDAVADAHGFEGRVVLQPDSRLLSGDCRIEWTDGGAQRDQARLAAEIEASIERALAPPERRFAGAAPEDENTAEAGE